MYEVIELLSKPAAKMLSRWLQFVNICVTLVAPEHSSNPRTSVIWLMPVHQYVRFVIPAPDQSESKTTRFT